MQKFEIYVYDHMNEYDWLDSQINKGRLWFCAVKIGKYFYEVNFYRHSTLNPFILEQPPALYCTPNLIIVSDITMEEIQNALNFLYDKGYFEHLKKYRSFSSIKFYINKENYKGKPLNSIISGVHSK